MRNETLEQKPDHQINQCGATETRMGCVSPPLSLIQNRTGDFAVPFARLRRSALQPPLQCTATAPAVHCIRPCSALHPSPHVLAVKRSFFAVQKSFPFILDWIPLRESPNALERAVGVRLYLLISCGSVVGPSTISFPLSSIRIRSISTTRSSGLLFMRPW